MKVHVIYLTMISLLLAACGNSRGSTRRTPPLTAPPPGTVEQAPKRNILEEVGDTTIRIVQEPARMATPKKSDPKQPQTYDPPAMIINRRGSVDPAETQPVHP